MAVDALERYFERFGEILEVVVIRDRNTSKPRGFGFVTFKDESAIDAVMAEEKHEIDGKEIDVKRSHQKESQSISSKKLFVGGMPNTVTQDAMLEYFSMFGPVEETQVMYDHMTGRSRGFGFVMFEKEEHAHACLYGGPHRLNGELVDVKPATPKASSGNTAMRPPPYYFQHQMPYQQYMPNYIPGYPHNGNASIGYMATGSGPQMNQMMMMHPAAIAAQAPLSPTAAQQQQHWMQPHRFPFVYSTQEDGRRDRFVKQYGGWNGRKAGRDPKDPLNTETVEDFSNNNNTSTQAPP